MVRSLKMICPFLIMINKNLTTSLCNFHRQLHFSPCFSYTERYSALGSPLFALATSSEYLHEGQQSSV
jgi:hypothetical protein